MYTILSHRWGKTVLVLEQDHIDGFMILNRSHVWNYGLPKREGGLSLRGLIEGGSWMTSYLSYSLHTTAETTVK